MGLIKFNKNRLNSSDITTIGSFSKTLADIPSCLILSCLTVNFYRNA